MALQKIKRWLLMLFFALMAVFVTVAGILQFYIFPNIDQYKNQIANQLSQSLHQTVSIADISIRWRGIHPQFKLQDLVLYDKQQRPALKLSTVTTHLSWSSLLILSPSLVSLSVESPNLTIRRTADGEVFLAGISMNTQGNPEFANWLLEQRRIKVTHATVTWVDEQRHAPALLLKDLNIELLSPAWQRILGRHNVHIDTLISNGTGQRITLDAVVVGHDVSKLETWHGETTFRTPEIDLSVWHPWLDLPIALHHGQGNITATFAFDKLKLRQLSALINLDNLSVTPPHHTQTFEARYLRGEIQWQQDHLNQSLNLKHLSADISPGLQLFDTTGQFSWGLDSHQGTLSSQKVIVENVAALMAWLPAQSPVTEYLEHVAPVGNLQRVEAHWKYANGTWQNYGLISNLSGISSQAYEQIPGVTNWSGKLEIAPNEGMLHLDTSNAKIDTANLLRWPLPIDHLEGDIRWEHNGEKTLISTHNLKFENPHLALQLVADYQLGATKGDTIQLSGQIERGDAKFAPFYYPVILGETTLHWLDTSILSGQVKHGEVIVKGRVKDFPFVNAKQQSDPQLGLFRVTAQVEHTSLEYGTGWPLLTDIEALLKFEGKRMDIAVKKGQTVNQSISQAQVEIPQLDADWPMLNIKATANGPVEQGVKFVNSSPVKQVTMGFTESLQAMGEGNLHLALQVPLNDVEQARFQGDYAVKNGHLAANLASGMPEMSNINGHLKFNEKSLQIQAAQLIMFDNPATFSLSTRNDKSILIQTSGKMTDTALRKMDNNLLTKALHGSTDWKANLLIQPPNLRMDIFSSLTGMSIDLPAPLNKSADSPANLVIRLRQENAQQDKVVVHYNQWIHANLLRSHTDQETQISAGEISVNTPMRTAMGSGMNIHASFPKLNVDDWLDYINQPQGNGPASAAHAFAINTLELTADTLQVFDRNLHQIKLNMSPNQDKLHLAVQSQEMAGDVDWISGKPSKLIAKLNYLRVPRIMDTDNSPPPDVQHSSSAYPEVEISAQEFQFGDKQLGSLELKAANSGENWIIQKLNLINPDSQLSAEGNWRNSVRSPQTTLKFNLTSNNLGKTLQRFQPGEMIKGGNGALSGQIGWPGSPHEFAVERLDGNLSMQLEKGQILKVKPGVGRLLGLLSLQSLPRRLSLDFRDLFSQGFAFDKISCTANMQDGVLRSDDLFMTGPAAEAKIKGETNLKDETQKLKVKVVPHITDSVSLAALAGGPIVGVAAFVAQKLLKDPLNKISSTEYTIGGTWDNPQELDVDHPVSENQVNQTMIKH